MPTNEQLSATIGKIYEAAVDPALWDDALGAIASFTGSAGAVLHVIPKTRDGIIASYLGAGAREAYSPENVTEWVEQYASQCPRLAAGARWPEQPFIVDYMLLSEAEMDRNPVYQWYGSHGLRYFVGSMLPEVETARVAWSLQRSRAEGHAQRSEIDSFLLLKPHLAQAITLADRLGTLGSGIRNGAMLYDVLPYALFALDSAGCVQFANSGAERLLAHGDALRIKAHRLVAPSPTQQSKLDCAIVAALNKDNERPRGGWLRLDRPSGRQPYSCFVTHFERSEAFVDRAAPVALVIVIDPDEVAAPDEEGIRDLFGLTASEARIAAALASGHSIQSAAAQLGVSPETLRFHLKHIFRKLGVGRQQDLVRVLGHIAVINGGLPIQGMAPGINKK